MWYVTIFPLVRIFFFIKIVFRNPKFQFDNCELVEVAWAPGAPAAACWRRLHRARTPWEAAEDALASASSEAADQAP